MNPVRQVDSAAPSGVFIYVERSKECGKLYSALGKALGDIEEPKKNRTGQYGEYADLAALRKATRGPLAANGLFVMQTFHIAGSELILNTTLGHSSGEYVSSQVPIKTSQNPQQTMGYATYMRRMAYSAILSLSAEDDDDGEAASDAAASAANDGQQAEVNAASKALRQAESPERVSEVLEKVHARIASKAFPALALPQLIKVADERIAQLKKAAQKPAKPQPQEVAK